MPKFDNSYFKHSRNFSTICINGYYDTINKKCKYYDRYQKARYSYFNSEKKRNLLSNDTDTFSSITTKLISYDLLYYSKIIFCLILIFIFIHFIRNFYKKWKKMKEDKQEKEENELSEKAKINFEKNYLNSKTFSFIPITTPVKLKGNTNKNSISDKNTNYSSNEEKNKKNNNNIIISEFEIDKAFTLEMKNINSFNLSNNDEKKCI